MKPRKFLGIDFGTKKIGLAISDDNGSLAFPKEVVLNDENLFEKISKIIDEENISDIVVGESVDFSGKLNVLSSKIDIFILELQSRFNLSIHKQKEFLTSVEARKSVNTKNVMNQSQSHSKIKKMRTGNIDASAAALILQRYLDKINIHSKL